MALTLPYPDMVFVPLDILTAEEQNQLVGNIEFLANQFPIGTSNIADGAISNDKLNFSSMPCFKAYSDNISQTINKGSNFVFNTAQINVGGFSISSGRVVIPASGTYAISAIVSGDSNGTSGYAQLKTSSGGVFASVINRPQSRQFTSLVIPCTLCELNQNDVVGVYNQDEPYIQGSGMGSGNFANIISIRRVG